MSLGLPKCQKEVKVLEIEEGEVRRQTDTRIETKLK